MERKRLRAGGGCTWMSEWVSESVDDVNIVVAGGDM